MKKIKQFIGIFSLVIGFVVIVHAAQICQSSDFLCFESGPTENLKTPFRIDSAGNVTINANETVTGINTLQSDTIFGASGVATPNTSITPSIDLELPILVSTAIAQGMAIIATTQNQVGVVNGVMSTTSGATSVLGVSDTAASSGTVVNVDFSGLAVALTTGTITVGDLLVSTATWPGYLVTNNSASAGAIVGVSLVTQASTYNGLTRVLLKH